MLPNVHFISNINNAIIFLHSFNPALNNPPHVEPYPLHDNPNNCIRDLELVTNNIMIDTSDSYDIDLNNYNNFIENMITYLSNILDHSNNNAQNINYISRILLNHYTNYRYDKEFLEKMKTDSTFFRIVAKKKIPMDHPLRPGQLCFQDDSEPYLQDVNGRCFLRFKKHYEDRAEELVAQFRNILLNPLETNKFDI
jgi:hypothetical protein